MKKILAFFLTLILILSSVSIGLINASAEMPTDIPVILVRGYGSSIYKTNEDGTKEKVYPIKVDKDEILEIVKENYDVFLKAFVTQNWSDFDDLLAETIADIYDDIRLDENGDPRNGTVSSFHMAEWQVKKAYDNYDGLETFTFNYDWRLDPYDVIDDLGDYIDLVLKVTGAKEYALCGRCLGANVALTYYNETKDPRIKNLIIYAGGIKGVSPIGELFSGELCIDSDAAERYLYDYNDLEDEYDVGGMFTVTSETILEMVTAFCNIYGTDLVSWAVCNVYSRIYSDILPRVLLSSYGTFPGYWAMVNEDYFEEAKECVFGDNTEEYAGLIEKIDNYYNNITLRAEEILLEAQSNGIEVSNIVKWGKQVTPLIEDYDALADGNCLVKNASFGAACGTVTAPLDDEYLSSADSRYISPDKRIDASTALFKDKTWFIRNQNHNNFSVGNDRLIFAIVNNENFTVFSDENYPQYMMYDDETDSISPDTNQAGSQDEWREVDNSFMRRIKDFFSFLFKIKIFFLKILFPKATYRL